MEFTKNHNLTDDALARIGQSVGEDLEPPTQPAGTEEDEERANQIIQMIGMELSGQSPTVTQLVLRHFADDLTLMPGYRGPATAKKKSQVDVALQELMAEDWEGQLYGLMDEIFERMDQIRQLAQVIPGDDRSLVEELADNISYAISAYNEAIEEAELRGD